VADGTATIATTGDVDVATADQFHASLAAAIAEHPRTVVDLTASSFLDSSGMRVLVTFAHELSEIVVSGNGPIAGKLRLAALDQILPVRMV
jgi:anti-anti-sigma factor